MDKENVVPTRATTRNGGSHVPAQGKVFDARKFDSRTSDPERARLEEAALAKNSPPAAHDALFRHDSAKMVHLAPEIATKAFLNQLERDSAGLENASYLKMRVWVSFASFVETRSPGGCVRMVYERMLR